MPNLTRSTLVPSASTTITGVGVNGSGTTTWNPLTNSGDVTIPAYQSQEGELYTEYGRKTDHLCSNYQRETSFNRPSVTYARSSRPQPQLDYYEYTTDWPGRWWFDSSHVPYGYHGLNGLVELMPSSEASFDTFVNDAIFDLLPGIKPDMSLLNSLYELKDFKKLPATISKFKFALSSLRKLKSTKARGKKQTLKMITGLGTDAYLTDQFAIRPLWSDLLSIIDAMTSYRKQVERLLEYEGKIRKSHWVRPCGTELDLLPVTQSVLSHANTDYYGGNVHKRVVTYPEVPTFRAQLVYRYNLRGFERNNAHLWGALDSLGINLNPAHIWNAIPFSFMVDWVIKVGDFLDRRQMRNIEPITDIIRFSWSYSVRRKVEMYSTLSYGGPVTTGETKVGETFEDFYYRRPGLPAYDRLLKVSGLSLKEFTLGGAVVGGIWSGK